MATAYSTRDATSDTYSTRAAIWWTVMAIISSGFWDDLEVWEDNKVWIDTWWTSFGTIYTERPTI